MSPALLGLIVNAAVFGVSVLASFKLLLRASPYSLGRELLRLLFEAIALITFWGMVFFAGTVVFGTAWLRHLK